MNEIDNTVERIGQLDGGAWIILPSFTERGPMLAQKLKDLANAYTKAVADNEKLRACAEHYADELNWGLSDGQDVPRVHDWYSPVDEKMRYEKKHGYTVAQQTLDEILGVGKE